MEISLFNEEKSGSSVKKLSLRSRDRMTDEEAENWGSWVNLFLFRELKTGEKIFGWVLTSPLKLETQKHFLRRFQSCCQRNSYKNPLSKHSLNQHGRRKNFIAIQNRYFVERKIYHLSCNTAKIFWERFYLIVRKSSEK